MKEAGRLARHAAAAYVAPFAVFVVLLAAARYLPAGGWGSLLRLAAPAAALGIFSRRILDLRPRRTFSSIGVGVMVFAIWVAPDIMWAGYRSHWLFENAITGGVASTLSDADRGDWAVLALRAARAVIIVPLVEELFWRGWLMRWLIRSDFEAVAPGTYSAGAFWITAVLFASEHGPYWDVGLLAGIVYNGWLLRTRKLADCILAHSVTNAALSAYVLATGKWEYWL